MTQEPADGGWGTENKAHMKGVGSYTLSGRIDKVVASHAAVARSVLAEVALIYTMHDALRGYCP